jgi:hypothetical protein
MLKKLVGPTDTLQQKQQVVNHVRSRKYYSGQSITPFVHGVTADEMGNIWLLYEPLHPWYGQSHQQMDLTKFKSEKHWCKAQALVIGSLAALMQSAHACYAPLQTIGECVWVTKDYVTKILEYQIDNHKSPFTTTKTTHKLMESPYKLNTNKVYKQKISPLIYYY